MGQDGKKAEHIVIDANIILSSLLRHEGYTQAVLSILLCSGDVKVIAPSEVIKEIERHRHEISRRSGLPSGVVTNSLRLILRCIKQVSEDEFRDETVKALSLVVHKEDAPSAGLALKHSPSIVLTYNKRHFISDKLGKEGVRVFMPKELMEYLNMELKTARRLRRKGGFLKLMSGFLVKKKRGYFSFVVPRIRK